MNIFYLSHDPITCAQQHNDKHVVKMCIEYAQLLSTAHRTLDGNAYEDRTANNRKITRWKLNDTRESVLMKASHVNHPSAVWTRQSHTNYQWLFQMWSRLLDEYTFRYGKHHACGRLKDILSHTPERMPIDRFTQPPPAMPDDCKISTDAIECYRTYYRKYKAPFCKWKNRPVPDWFTTL